MSIAVAKKTSDDERSFVEFITAARLVEAPELRRSENRKSYQRAAEHTGMGFVSASQHACRLCVQ